MPSTLHGVIPALVTPKMPHAEEPDTARLTAHVGRLLSAGVHGLFVCSSTGEAPLLSWKQRRLVIETVVGSVGGRVPVLAGVGAASTAESLRLARDAQGAGATHLTVLPCHFVPVTQDELYGYFAAVAESSELPVLLYNYPARTGGQCIAPETVARLARHYDVIGLKDSGGDLAYGMACLAACGPEFALFVGPEALIRPTLLVGGAGTVCAAANVVPALVVALYNAIRAGRDSEAATLQARLLFWGKINSHGTFPAPVKAAMESSGQPVGDPFLPVQPVTEQQRHEIAGLLATIRGDEG